MNAVQIEIAAQRMLRPESVRARRQEGLIHALAYELRCAANTDAVLVALRRERTAVLVDDLEHWIPANGSGLDSLRALLALMQATRNQVFWIVSSATPFVELVQQAAALEEGFGFVVRLSPLSVSELRQAIELRHSLSGLTLVIPHVLGTLPSRLLRSSDADLLFRVLHSMSGGNPSGAFSLWLNSVRVQGTQARVLLDRLLAQQLQFSDMLDVMMTAALIQLHRFGPATDVELAGALGVSPDRLRPHLLALRNAGLLAQGVGKQLSLTTALRAVLISRLPARGRFRG
jgi:DNA-binding transcriptional ArsR family regulator